MTRAPFDIFLSYAGGSPDASRYALSLAEELEIFGLRTWFAGRDRGDYGDDVLEETLATTPVFMACLGARKPGSWGRQEIARAAKRYSSDPNYLLCTVLLPGAEPADVDSLPEEFHQSPTFDLRYAVDPISVGEIIPAIWQRLQPERFALLERIVEACRMTSAVVLIGPAGSGKTVLAQVAMNLLRNEYPGGYTFLSVERDRSLESLAGIALNYLHPDRREASPGRVPISVYQRQLSDRKCLLVFDEVLRADLERLAPPPPSTAIFTTQRRLHFSIDHMRIEVPRPPARAGRTRASLGMPPKARPGYTSDVAGGEDLLEITESVDAICSVIAARDVEPPLSIGLFGEWGAGKSFFLEKMQERIQELAEASRTAKKSDFHASIRQIEFNAWHYADVNLWASLASRIFQGLAGEDDDAARDIVAELPSTRAKLAAAKDAVAHAEKKIEETAEKTRTKMRELGDDAVAPLASRIADKSTRDSLLLELRKVLPQGESEETLTGQEVLDVADDLLSAFGTIRTAVSMSKRAAVVALMAFTIGVAIVLLVPFAPLALGSAVATILVAIRAMAGPARWARRASDIVQERTEEARRRQESEREMQEEGLLRELRASEQRRDLAQGRVDEIEREIEEVGSGQRLSRFIAERSEGAAYEPYLGVVSVVRQDFEELARQIERHAEEADGHLALERIVLYVDDLDRCPPERVVQVLEAVHLLMASELFVVVVAVDPRWLLWSLERHHVAGLGSAAWTPAPHDYLEKIFQIPYGIPPMSQRGLRRLIEDVVLVQEPGRDPLRNSDHGRDAAYSSPRNDETSTRRRGPGASAKRSAPPPAEKPLVDLEPEGLQLLPEERDFMWQLGGILKTPRTAKRLVNLYLLVRVSLSPQRLHKLIGSESRTPNFPFIQLLLAIVIGAPTIATPLLSDLRTTKQTAWWSWVDAWAPPQGQEETWRRLVEGMEPLRLELSPSTDEFAGWVPDVIRFSYDASPLLDGALPTGA